jgi:predicted nucleotidyltransferase
MSDPDPATDSSLSQLERVLDVLDKHAVDYIVIGGQAEVLLGSSRVTYDTDFAYSRSLINLQRLTAALSDLQVRLRNVPEGVPFLIDSRTLQAGCNFTFECSLGNIDFLGYVEPIGDFSQLLPHAEKVALGGRTIRIIGLEDLIRIRNHLRRPRDRESLPILLAIRQRRLSQQNTFRTDEPK